MNLPEFWLGEFARRALRKFFSELDQDIRDYQASQRESWEHDLNALLTVLDRNSPQGLRSQAVERLRSAMRRLGIELNIEVKILNRTERTRGSDFIVFLDSKVGSLQIRKGMLVQAKKLYSAWPVANAGSTYDAYAPDQAVKMLDVTASSFYLLYNPPTVEVDGGLDNDVGMQIAAASSVLAVAETNPPSYNALRKHMIPFSEFMVDYFIQTAVGDPRLRLEKRPKGWLVMRDETGYNTPPPEEQARPISTLEISLRRGEIASAREGALF